MRCAHHHEPPVGMATYHLDALILPLDDSHGGVTGCQAQRGIKRKVITPVLPRDPNTEIRATTLSAFSLAFIFVGLRRVDLLQTSSIYDCSTVKLYSSFLI